MLGILGDTWSIAMTPLRIDGESILITPIIKAKTLRIQASFFLHFTHRGLRTVLLRGLPGRPPRLAVVDGGGAVQVIHCTEWKSEEIGYEIVNSFAEEISARSAQGGVLLTFGRITRGASTLAADRNIEVVSGIKLTRMLRASGWESSRLESGPSTGFGNTRTPDSRHGR